MVWLCWKPERQWTLAKKVKHLVIRNQHVTEVLFFRMGVPGATCTGRNWHWADRHCRCTWMRQNTQMHALTLTKADASIAMSQTTYRQVWRLAARRCITRHSDGGNSVAECGPLLLRWTAANKSVERGKLVIELSYTRTEGSVGDLETTHIGSQALGENRESYRRS